MPSFFRNKFLLILIVLTICLFCIHLSYIIDVRIKVKKRGGGIHVDEHHAITPQGRAAVTTATTMTAPEDHGRRELHAPNHASQHINGNDVTQPSDEGRPSHGSVSPPTPTPTTTATAPAVESSAPTSITSSTQETNPLPPQVDQRRTAIRNAFKHAWQGYKSRAWGHDDLKPLSGSFSDWVRGGVGMTIIDGIDTAWIMGLQDEYKDGLNWIRENLHFNKPSSISVFECTIRVLGGLVSAFDLTGEEIFKQKAREIADRLAPAFGSKTGVPFAQVNLGTGAKMNNGWAAGGTVLSEWSTIQLEFRRLSMITGDPQYDALVTRVMEVFERHQRADGLYPTFYSNQMDRFTNAHVSFGAWGDSFYEYLLKQYLLTGKTEPKYLEWYKKSMDGMFEKLVKKSKPSGFTYIQEMNGPSGPNKMDHLVCFAGGMLLLGSDFTGKKERDVEAGLAITETCRETYKRSASGLGPETFIFTEGQDFVPGVKDYLLRPETVESLFYAWRYTHDQKYRDWGWEIFEAIEKHCKTPYGYCSVRNVASPTPLKADEMHSFYLAETLKYLYLLFSPDELISLDAFVFNTEAHPMRIEGR
mmetsp:Transcript_2149/g.7836  ORF Transcript_2149/g.7836 Transcript_2149/m.7836 type:complete len:587 (-) Transcript_2149:2011-3771(-)